VLGGGPDPSGKAQFGATSSGFYIVSEISGMLSIFSALFGM